MFLNGIYYMECPDQKAECCLVSVSADLSKNEKPVYLSIMMDEQQLKSIIDNENLFDKSLINAAYLLLSQYKSLEINCSE